MKKRILLLYPAKLDKEGKPIRFKRPILKGLTLPYLAALTPEIEKYDIKIYNDSYNKIPFEENWDLVGISMMSTQAARGYEIATYFKNRNIPVVIGGFHATLAPDEVKEYCDAVVIGEAEYSWPELINDYFNKGFLKKIYKSDKLHDLKNLPSPRFDLLYDLNKYLDKSFPVQTTRGCPFNCNYCEVTQVYGAKYRQRPLDEVFRDIENIKQKDKIIYFVDDNVVANKRHARELFNYLKKNKIKWAGLATLNFVDDDDLFNLAIESGCYHLNFGMESINQKSLSTVSKHHNIVENYHRQLEKLNKSKLWYSINIMFGLDEDDKNICEDTLNFLINHKVPISFIFILAPRPGTKIREILLKENRILHSNWTKYSGCETVYIPKNFTPEELEKEMWKVYKKFYSSINIFNRVLVRRLKNKKYVLFLNIIFSWAIRKKLHPVMMF